MSRSRRGCAGWVRRSEPLPREIARCGLGDGLDWDTLGMGYMKIEARCSDIDGDAQEDQDLGRTPPSVHPDVGQAFDRGETSVHGLSLIF